MQRASDGGGRRCLPVRQSGASRFGTHGLREDPVSGRHALGGQLRIEYPPLVGCTGRREEPRGR